MKKQQNWSKVGSGSNAALRRKLSIPDSSFESSIYGIITAIKNDNNSYFVKIAFEKEDIHLSYKDTWFILDISTENFTEMFGSIDAFQNLLSKKTINCAVQYYQPHILNGRAIIIADLKNHYDGNSYHETWSIGAISNGINNPSKNFKLIKPLSAKNVKTGIKLSETQIDINADEKNFIGINEKGMTFAATNMSMQMMPENISFGNIIGMQKGFLGLIPSTSFLPISQYTFNLPTELIKTLDPIVNLTKTFVGT